MIDLKECAKSLEDAPNCLEFLQAWMRWRGEKLIASASSVRPEELGTTLDELAVLEYQPPGAVNFRLAGATQVHMMNRPLRGENLMDLTAPSDYEGRLSIVRNTTSYPCGLLATWTASQASELMSPMCTLLLPVLPPVSEGPVRLYVAVDRLADLPKRNYEPLKTYPTPGERIYVDLGHGAPSDEDDFQQPPRQIAC